MEKREHQPRQRGLLGDGFLLKAGVGDGALRMCEVRDRRGPVYPPGGPGGPGIDPMEFNGDELQGDASRVEARACGDGPGLGGREFGLLPEDLGPEGSGLIGAMPGAMPGRPEKRRVSVESPSRSTLARTGPFERKAPMPGCAPMLLGISGPPLDPGRIFPTQNPRPPGGGAEALPEPELLRSRMGKSATRC